MTEPPGGWAVTPLDSVVTFSIGGLWGSKPNDAAVGAPTVAVMRGADYRNWADARASGAAIRSVSLKAAETRRLEVGDLVVEISGGGPTQPVGRVVVIDEPALRSTTLPLIHSNFCRRLVLHRGVNPWFVYYQLLHKYLAGDTERFQTATTNIRNLNFTKYLSETFLTVAPLAEQNSIVAAIEEQVSRLDAGVVALERVRKNLKRVRAAILQRTVQAHQELNTVAIDGTIRVVDYRGRTPPFAKVGIPHLRSFNVKSGTVNWDGCAYVTRKIYDKYMSRGFPEVGDLLFTTEAPMGEVAFAPRREFCMAQRMMLLKPDRKVWSPEYLMYHLRSPWFQSKLQISATGTTVRGISSRNFRPLTLIAPPLDEQERLVLTIRKELADVDTLEHDLRTAKIRAQRLRSSVLGAAFSGKLVPQDPTDEPATALLEHIAAERISSNSHKAIRILRHEASSPDPDDAALRERRMGIQLMWEDGYSRAEIAETMEISPTQVGSEMTRMRHQGWDLPKRRRKTTA